MANYFSWKSINLSHCDFYHFIFTSIGWIFVLLKKACLFFLYLLYQSILFCFRHLLLSYSMATSFNPVSVILLTYLLHFTFSNFFPIFLNTSMAGPFSSFFPVFDLCLVASTFSDSHFYWLPFLNLLLMFYSYHLLSMPTQAHFFQFHLFPFLHIHFYDPTTKSLKLYVQNRKVPSSIWILSSPLP